MERSIHCWTTSFAFFKMESWKVKKSYQSQFPFWSLSSNTTLGDVGEVETNGRDDGICGSVSDDFEQIEHAFERKARSMLWMCLFLTIISSFKSSIWWWSCCILSFFSVKSWRRLSLMARSILSSSDHTSGPHERWFENTRVVETAVGCERAVPAKRTFVLLSFSGVLDSTFSFSVKGAEEPPIGGSVDNVDDADVIDDDAVDDNVEADWMVLINWWITFSMSTQIKKWLLLCFTLSVKFYFCVVFHVVVGINKQTKKVEMEGFSFVMKRKELLCFMWIIKCWMKSRFWFLTEMNLQKKIFLNKTGSQSCPILDLSESSCRLSWSSWRLSLSQRISISS